MNSLLMLLALLSVAFAPVSAFAPARSFGVMPTQVSTTRSIPLFMAESEEETPVEPPRRIQRGVSIDKEGTSNVWALEPKMEISNKSQEEQTQSALFAAGGVMAALAAAAVILVNLPDPNQY